MPTLTRPDGEINYLTFGDGFPVLLFAPGGLRSSMGFWRSPADGPAAALGGLDRSAPCGGFHRRRHGPAQCRQVEGRHQG